MTDRVVLDAPVRTTPNGFEIEGKRGPERVRVHLLESAARELQTEAAVMAHLDRIARAAERKAAAARFSRLTTNFATKDGYLLIGVSLADLFDD